MGASAQVPAPRSRRQSQMQGVRNRAPIDPGALSAKRGAQQMIISMMYLVEIAFCLLLLVAVCRILKRLLKD